MLVKKRNGTMQSVDLNKITKRLQVLINGLDEYNNNIGNILDIDPISIATKVCGQLKDGISTDELDKFSAETCAYMVGEHLHYGLLANRLIISAHHKNTKCDFYDIIEDLYRANQIKEEFYSIVKENKDLLNSVVNSNHHSDYKRLNYFAMKTLIGSYFLKVRSPANINEIVSMERYQHMLMRQALTIHSNDISKAIIEYNNMSNGYYTHATPTIYNSGTRMEQLSSCFLLGTQDSLYGMYNQTLSNGAQISKTSGGIGLTIGDIRASGSLIVGTNGKSDGLMPYIKQLDGMSSHVNQGGRRKGSIAVYLEPWHADIMFFLDAKKNTGMEELRARNLFYGLWIPDIFMERVEKALLGTEIVYWSLMCPSICKGLTDSYGKEFNKLYLNYEASKKYKEQVNILNIWNAILSSQSETGTPYMCYKDSVNRKNAQKNLGVIKNSNLCTEIMEYSSHDEYATCNLASINLRAFVRNGEFDFNALEEISQSVCNNLNNIIDINAYPVKESKRSNFKHRPIGIGVQGLAETFIELNMEFTSPKAKELNKLIFETIYYGALKESNKLAEERHNMLSSLSQEDFLELQKNALLTEIYTDKINLHEYENTNDTGEMQYIEEIKRSLSVFVSNCKRIVEKYDLPRNVKYDQYAYLSHENIQYRGAYYSFHNSPAQSGILQYDMWNSQPSPLYAEKYHKLKENIQKYGLRNSLLTTVMPTATTSHILGNTECIEPISSTFYVKNIISGSFLVVNEQLQRILTDMNLWSKDLKNKILKNNGSVQDIKEIPENIRKLFLTSYEISKKELINMSVDRSPFIDQSQSLNHFISVPSKQIIQTIHIYGWKSGLKTGSYYIRTKPPIEAKKITTDETYSTNLTSNSKTLQTSNSQTLQTSNSQTLQTLQTSDTNERKSNDTLGDLSNESTNSCSSCSA